MLSFRLRWFAYYEVGKDPGRWNDMVSGFPHPKSLPYIVFLIWCLLNYLGVLSIFTLFRLGYMRAFVWNLKLSCMKIQHKPCCFLAYGQGMTQSISLYLRFVTDQQTSINLLGTAIRCCRDVRLGQPCRFRLS